MEIYNDKYRKVNFEPENKILYIEWFRTTEDLTEEEYKEESLAIPGFAKEKEADKILINAVNSLFIVTPEIQDWVNKNIVHKYLEAGVLKLAILLPTELFTQISIEQIVDDSIAVAQKRIQYFGDEAAARQWLNA